MIRVGKYEFASESKAIKELDKLGVKLDEKGDKYNTHLHSIVHLGHIVLQPATYDEDGNEITPAVLSPKYHVDILWDLPEDEDGKVKEPMNFKAAKAIITGPPAHQFMGREYEQFKFKADE